MARRTVSTYMTSELGVGAGALASTSIAAMADRPIDVDELVADLKERADRERAEGRYPDADELAALELEVASPDSVGGMLAQGFDLGGTSTRVRFRPELGYSSKPVVGPLITGVKKLNLRLLFFVLDDLARQADAAITRLESALAAEIAAREAVTEGHRDALRAEREARETVERELQALSERLAALEEQAKRGS